MKKTSKIHLAASLTVSAVLLTGCSGGHDAKSSCQSIGPNTNYLSIGGSVDNVQAIADGNLSSFASVTVQAAGTYVDAQGNPFPGGSNAGVFLTPPAGTSATDITVSTFLSVDNTSVESATGPLLTLTPTQGDPATEYASFTTTLPFNGVKLTINTPNAAAYLVYEVCGAATVR